MPNAKDIKSSDLGKNKFILVGPPGSGKTAQLLTLPGKTFVYIFDPNSLATLRGHDIDYEIFQAEVHNLAALSLSKGKGDQKTAIMDAYKVYELWENDFEEKIRSGFFADYDNVCGDSFTTFSDMVMDRILQLNGRAGQWPQQDDWGAQMETIRSVVRTMANMSKMVVWTAHDLTIQDELTKRIQNQLMVTGRLKVKLPLLFTDILHCDCTSSQKAIEYRMQTRPDRMNPALRTSIRGLEMFEDVTIKDWKQPKNYGLGKLLRRMEQ